MPAPIRKLNLWFRANSVYISLSVIIIAFGAILLMLANSQNKLAEQSEQNKQVLLQLKTVTEQISKAAVTRTSQINGIDRHLDCIVVFFAQPDRANKSITDINTCELQDSKTGKTSVSTPIEPSSSTPVESKSQSSNSTQQSTNTPTSQNTKAPTVFNGLKDFIINSIKAL